MVLKGKRDASVWQLEVIPGKFLKGPWVYNYKQMGILGKTLFGRRLKVPFWAGGKNTVEGCKFPPLKNRGVVGPQI